VAAAGTDSSRIGVVATVRTVRDETAHIDVGATVEPMPALIAAGVTDIRLGPAPLPARRPARTEILSDIVQAFNRVTGR
jgi:hypothetical protein